MKPEIELSQLFHRSYTHKNVDVMGLYVFSLFLCNMVGTWELEVMRDHLREALSRVTTSLIQQLTRRDRLLLERDRHFDVITAILQAASQKRSNTIK